MSTHAVARRFALPGAAMITAASLGWLSASGAAWLLPLVLGVAGLLLLVLSASVRAIAPYTIGVLLIIASSTTFLPGNDTVISLGLRVVGIGFLVLSSFQKSSRTASFSFDRELNSAEIWSWLPWVIVSYLLYLLLSTAFHGQWIDFILYGGGVVLLVVALVATAIAVPNQVVAKGVIAALVIVLALSVVYGLTVPSVGIAGTRLRGVTTNGNTLGFYAFLLGSLALIVVKNVRVRLVLFALSVVVIVWTSSRASALALAIVVVCVFLSRRSIVVVLAGFGVIGAGVVAGVAWPRTFDVLGGLLRDNNSRTQTIDSAIEAFRSSPLIGIGMGNSPDEIASSPLRALAFAGIGGLIAVIVLWISLLWFSRRGGIQTVGFAIAAIIHSLFEGWLLSPVGPLLLVFVLCWWVIVRHPSTLAMERHHRSGRELRTAIGAEIPATAQTDGNNAVGHRW